MIVPISCKPDRNPNCKITSHKSANGITDYKVVAEINGTTLLTSATQYAQRPKHYLTAKAERLSWDIFSQEWDNFSEYPAGKVPSLVAQLIGINPCFADATWISCYAIPMFKDAGDAETCKLLNEFIRRIDVTLANIATGELKPVGDVVSDGLVIRRIDFIAFAERVRWLPGQLPGDIKQQKTLIPLVRSTSELLLLAYRIFEHLNISVGDTMKISAKEAWGIISSGRFAPDLIANVSGTRATTEITLNGGNIIDYDAFSRTYNSRFQITTHKVI